MKSLVFLLGLLAVAPATAQNRVPPPRVPAAIQDPVQVPRVSRERRVPAAPGGASDRPGLSSNVTLSFVGTLPGAGEIDIEFTGCGPRFVADLAGPPDDDPSLPDPIVTLSAVLTETDAGYRVEYSLGARVAVPTSTMQGPAGQVSRNIEFRDMLMSGAAIAKPGESVVISRLNGKPLTLTVTLPG